MQANVKEITCTTGSTSDMLIAKAIIFVAASFILFIMRKLGIYKFVLMHYTLPQLHLFETHYLKKKDNLN